MEDTVNNYTPNNQSIVVFQPDAQHHYPLHFDSDERQIWATQKQIATMFDLDVRTISHHIQNFKKQRGEAANEGIQSFRIPTAGGMQDVEHYNHQVIAFIGYNAQATEKTILFQQWVESLIAKSLQPLQDASPLALAHHMLEALERQQSQLDNHSERLTSLEAHVQPELEYFTIMGYCHKHKLTVSTNQAMSYGQRAKRLSLERNMPVGKINDVRYGEVNTYHVSILNEIIEF